MNDKNIITIEELELKKKEKKKQLEHDSIIFYAMVALGIFNCHFIDVTTKSTLQKQAISIIDNAYEYIKNDSSTEEINYKLVNSFRKLGMTKDTQKEKRVIDIAKKNSIEYIQDLQDLQDSKNDNISEEYIKEKAIKKLRISFSRHMQSITLMEFYRLYLEELARWKRSTAKIPRKAHIPLYGRTFLIKTGMLNVPHTIDQIETHLPCKGLLPTQLFGCQCSMVLVTVSEEVYETFIKNMFRR